MKILYCCLFPSILYSCETWGDISPHSENLLLVERKALKACLGVKASTPEEILYVELNRTDIILDIHSRQYKFYRKFLELDMCNSTAKRIWQKLHSIDSDQGKPFLEYYESLVAPSSTNNIDLRKTIITTSGKAMHERYHLLFDLDYNNILYNSMVDDRHRALITRWRLSCHPLFIETGRRFKHPNNIERAERKCLICNILEDEAHALFNCRAHAMIRTNHQTLLNEYTTVNQILNPRTYNSNCNIPT